MSRVGKKPIAVPSGVEFSVKDNVVTVKGPKGTLTKEFNKNITIKLEDGHIKVERPNDEPSVRAIHGTTRALINNMIKGVHDGYRKSLTLVGVGYRAATKGKGLEISLGYSHPVIIDEIPANIRAKRPPEPYKGKGVKYADEHIRRKEGKKS